LFVVNANLNFKQISEYFLFCYSC